MNGSYSTALTREEKEVKIPQFLLEKANIQQGDKLEILIRKVTAGRPSPTPPG